MQRLFYQAAQLADEVAEMLDCSKSHFTMCTASSYHAFLPMVLCRYTWMVCVADAMDVITSFAQLMSTTLFCPLEAFDKV